MILSEFLKVNGGPKNLFVRFSQVILLKTFVKSLNTCAFLYSQLGESGEIKAIGELDLLFMTLRNACI